MIQVEVDDWEVATPSLPSNSVAQGPWQEAEKSRFQRPAEPVDATPENPTLFCTPPPAPFPRVFPGL